MNKNDSILVTGAAGLIGSAIIWALNQRGFENIIATDFLGTDERWKNLVPLRFKDYLEGDEFLERLDDAEIDSIKWVFHLGACSATTEKNARYLIQNNFEYTKRLAEWAVKGRRRFVYASSAATYGDGSHGMLDGMEHLDAYRPLNMYGYSKHLFDLYARQKGWLDEIVGLKYFNVFGPNENHKGDMRSVVNKAYDQIRSEGKVSLFRSYNPDYKDGEQERDFVYVKDAVAMTLHLAETPTAAGIFNIGTAKASTWIQLVSPIFRAMGIQENIQFIDMPETLRGKYQYHTCADISRLKATGWQGARYTLEDAVMEYVRDYLIPGYHLGDEKK